MNCESCGEKITQTVGKFCEHCGAPLLVTLDQSHAEVASAEISQPVNKQISETTALPTQQNKKVWLIGAVIIFLLLVGGIWLLNGGEKAKNAATPGQPAIEEVVVVGDIKFYNIDDFGNGGADASYEYHDDDLNLDVVYRGPIKEYFAEGKGVLEWSDGEKYVGIFKEDDFNGQGTFFYADGTYVKGIWKNNELIQTQEDTAGASGANAEETIKALIKDYYISRNCQVDYITIMEIKQVYASAEVGITVVERTVSPESGDPIIIKTKMEGHWQLLPNGASWEIETIDMQEVDVQIDLDESRL